RKTGVRSGPCRAPVTGSIDTRTVAACEHHACVEWVDSDDVGGASAINAGRCKACRRNRRTDPLSSGDNSGGEQARRREGLQCPVTDQSTQQQVPPVWLKWPFCSVVFR